MKQFEKCPVSKICGACSMQGISYDKQLKIKQEKLDKLFLKMSKVNKIIGCDNPYNYRNKSQISFAYDERKNIIAGNYVQSTHIVVPVEKCQLVNEQVNEIFNTIIKIVKKYKISIFDEKRMSGFLRHVLIRNSNDNSQIMVVIVAGNNRFALQKRFVDELVTKFPNISSIILNINNRHTSMILGKRNYLIYGKSYITDDLCGYSFKISADSFYQINHAQTEKLYRYAIKMADINKNETVLDTYCGIGTIGIIASDKAKKVIGVEINKQAIKDAINNASYNKIKNIEFYCDDSSRFMEKYHNEVDVVILDPPRTGSDFKFLSSLVKLEPAKVVYISCNPDTQYRDLKYLIKKGYDIISIQPFDLFPHTDHIECVVLLEKMQSIK